MAQIFPRWTLKIPLVVGAAGPILAVIAVGAVWYYGSPSYTDVGYRPKQPVPYSHELHVGQLGLDCRYCHTTVDDSSVATVPPTQVCMNCHHIIKRDSDLLAPLRESADSGTSMRWVRVHNLPDYAYFDHSMHIRAGVGCASCHGPVHQMEVVTQNQPLSMGWCLDCHRSPEQHLRPADAITDMEWAPASDQAEVAAAMIAEKQLAPPEDCSGCHR